MTAFESLRSGLTRRGISRDEADAIIASYEAALDGFSRREQTAVLNEAAGLLADACPEHGTQADGLARCQCLAVFQLREFAKQAGKDTDDGSLPPAGESTQPAPALVWHVYEEDAPPPDHPRLFTTKAAAEQGTIDLYREMGNSCPDYSWRPDEDNPGAHELLAGAEPVGIYLAPVPVRATPPDLVALADFFQPGHTYTHRDGTTFQCFTVTTTPWNGQRLAVGWHTDETDITSISWRGIGEWRNDYDGRKVPVHGPSVPGTCARARATYDWVYGTTPKRDTPCRPYPEQRCVVTCRIGEGGEPR